MSATDNVNQTDGLICIALTVIILGLWALGSAIG